MKKLLSGILGVLAAMVFVGLAFCLAGTIAGFALFWPFGGPWWESCVFGLVLLGPAGTFYDWVRKQRVSLCGRFASLQEPAVKRLLGAVEYGAVAAFALLVLFFLSASPNATPHVPFDGIFLRALLFPLSVVVFSLVFKLAEHILPAQFAGGAKTRSEWDEVVKANVTALRKSVANISAMSASIEKRVDKCRAAEAQTCGLLAGSFILLDRALDGKRQYRDAYLQTAFSVANRLENQLHLPAAADLSAAVRAEAETQLAALRAQVALVAKDAEAIAAYCNSVGSALPPSQK